MEFLPTLWLLYFGFQTLSFVIASGMKLWQVIKGKHRRYSKWLKFEELASSALHAAALVGLWGFIRSIPFAARELWVAIFWLLVGMILIQPSLPKSRLLKDGGGKFASFSVWLGAAFWAMPMVWALWAYQRSSNGLWS